MTKRERILTKIVAEVAREGKVTRNAVRLYVENRISYAAFQEAVQRGLKAATHSPNH